MVRQLQTVRQAIGKAADSQRPTERVRMGVLIVDYPGTGAIAHVALNDPDQGAPTIVRARVLGGLTTGILPARTPVSIVIRHGQPIVVGFGSGLTTANVGDVVNPPDDGGGGTPIATAVWEKFMDSAGTLWTTFGGPPGWSVATGNPSISGTDDYLEFDASPIDYWQYNVTSPAATMLLNAVTVMEAKFYVPDGETTQVGLLIHGGLFGWVVALDSTGSFYIRDDMDRDVDMGVAITGGAGPSITTGVWYTLRVMRAGSTFTAYLNGVIIGTTAVNAPGGSRFEDVNGTIDGVNDTFTTFGLWVDDSLRVYINGLLQNPFTDYTTTYATQTFVMTTPPSTGDEIFVGYEARLNGLPTDNGHMPLYMPGVWARGGLVRFKDIIGWRMALP